MTQVINSSKARLVNNKKDTPEINLTRVCIDQGDLGSTCTELFGEFGQDYVGRQIRLVQSYDKPEDRLRRFTQQVFIDGKLEADQEVVKQV